ncbi:MAG TPA: MlaD family protein [Verrucomicrobiae bacterium]
MALQDLTPQLRTRLSRLERLVGWFVTLATILLVAGLIYYIYETARRKGWFLKKMPYYTFVHNATGLAVGDRVKLMGFDVGEITHIEAMPPEDLFFNVYIQFRVKEPYFGYLWEDSKAKVGAADFLGHRFIEVTKGTNGATTYAMHELRELTLSDAREMMASNKFMFAQDIAQGTNLLAHPGEWLTPQILDRLQAANVAKFEIVDANAPTKNPHYVWNTKSGRYEQIPEKSKGYWLQADESPALTERLESVVNTVESALPGFMSLTNRLANVLTNASGLVRHADDLLLSAKPIVTNFAQISANLSGPKGTLGDWLLPTNINAQLLTTLSAAGGTMNSAQTNLNLLSSNILASLENVASLTSNLNAQVQANGLILSQISDLIVHSDEMIQGLKRHWLLKSSFGAKTNQPIESIVKPRSGAKE